MFGDIRDAVRESNHLVRGEPADGFILGLACAGIAVTGATYATLGGGLPERLGLTLVKSLGKTGRLTAKMTEWITRSARDTVDTAALGAAVTKASFTAPELALRAARDAVKLDRAEGLVTVARDVSKVQAKAGTKAALEGVRVAEGPKDVRRLARLAEAKGGKTRAILKLAGRGAFALTAALLDLVWWIGMAAASLIGFAATVKRTTERTTLRYLALAQGAPGAGRARRGSCRRSYRASHASRRLDALERADVLRPFRREVRVIAGIEAHGDAAVILVGIELPFAGLHLDRGDFVEPAGLAERGLAIRCRRGGAGEIRLGEDRHLAGAVGRRRRRRWRQRGDRGGRLSGPRRGSGPTCGQYCTHCGASPPPSKPTMRQVS